MAIIFILTSQIIMELIITSIAMISVSNILITKSEKYLDLYRLNILIDNYKNGYGISLKEGYPY